MKKIIKSEKNLYWIFIGGIMLLCCGLQAGINGNKHQNVITEKTSDKLLVKDVKDNQERIIVFDGRNSSEMQYWYPGDTINIQNGLLWGKYKNTKVYNAYRLIVDKDLVGVRATKQNFDSVRNAMLMENNINKR